MKQWQIKVTLSFCGLVCYFISTNNVNRHQSFFGISPVQAHGIAIIRGKLNEIKPKEYRLEIELPANIRGEKQLPILPQRCQFNQDKIIKRTPGKTKLTYQFDCKKTPLNSYDKLLLPWQVAGSLISASWLDGTQRSNFFTPQWQRIEINLQQLIIKERSLYLSIKRYFILGFNHILTGWNHLLLLGIILLSPLLKTKIQLITALSFGHIISLLIFLIIPLNISLVPAELCTFLAVLIISRQYLKKNTQPNQNVKIIGILGTLHGLAIANILNFSTVTQAQLITYLLSLTLGIDAIQLFIIIGITAIHQGIDKLNSKYFYLMNSNFLDNNDHVKKLSILANKFTKNQIVTTSILSKKIKIVIYGLGITSLTLLLFWFSEEKYLIGNLKQMILTNTFSYYSSSFNNSQKTNYYQPDLQAPSNVNPLSETSPIKIFITIEPYSIRQEVLLSLNFLDVTNQQIIDIKEQEIIKEKIAEQLIKVNRFFCDWFFSNSNSFTCKTNKVILF